MDGTGGHRAEPARRHIDIAGPAPQGSVDTARRTDEAGGGTVNPRPSWSTTFDPSSAGNVLLPTGEERIAETTFDEWLATRRR